MDVQLPDGTLVRDVPDGMSKADLVAKLKANGHDVSGLAAPAPAAPQGYWDQVKANVTGSLGAVPDAAKNLTLGAVRGAGSIGATIMAPLDAGARALGVDPNGAVGGFIGRTDRREQMTPALESLGADPNSLAFKTGKLGGEIAGTAGAGGVLANGARAAGMAPAFINALATNGFRTGVALPLAQNMAVRSGAGALAGGAQVGLADPEHAGTGALLGGIAPVAAQGLGNLATAAGQKLRDTAEGLMASALKATSKAKRTGAEQTAIDTLLEKGVNVTKGGVNKLRGMVDDLNTQISDKIGASTATVDPSKVVNALGDTERRMAMDVAPTDNLNALAKVKDDFLNTYGAGPIPVQLAQKVKQGTYRNLADQYGELGTAAVEGRKGLARGLKDEIATGVPGVGQLNAEESKLLATLDVTERRVLQQASNNPIGLGVFAMNHPGAFATWLADRSPLVKSVVARTLNSLGSGLPGGVNALAGPAAFRAIPSTARTGLQGTPGPSP